MSYIHVEVVVAGIVSVQDKLLGGVGSCVKEDILEKGHGERILMCT